MSPIPTQKAGGAAAHVQAALYGERLNSVAVDSVRLIHSPSTRKDNKTTFPMKSNPLVLLALLASLSPVRSQDEKVDIQSETPSPTTARILGPVPDGTPPPPEAPKPGFTVPAHDVIATKSVEQGGRTISIREIKPIELPALPPHPIPAAPNPQFQERLAAYRADHPRNEHVFLSATVYRSKNSPPRTFVRWWPQHGGETIDFWSSVDFALIAGGIPSFIDTAGITRFMFISWSNVEIDKLSLRQTANAIPSIPDFSEGKATFAFIAKAPANEDILVIKSLHDLYNTHRDELLTAYQGREQARLKAEAELKAHPPQPKDITLSHWRIGGGETAPTKGATR